jgi:hypothetical protein
MKNFYIPLRSHDTVGEEEQPGPASNTKDSAASQGSQKKILEWPALIIAC